MKPLRTVHDYVMTKLELMNTLTEVSWLLRTARIRARAGQHEIADDYTQIALNRLERAHARACGVTPPPLWAPSKRERGEAA